MSMSSKERLFIGGWLVAVIVASLLPTAIGATESAAIAEAARPLTDGIPQVAVVRLRTLLREQTLGADERAAAMLKLGEALVAAQQPEDALRVLSDATIASSGEARFLQAQAHAALMQWPEALATYQQVASERDNPFRTEAAFGKAESLRALARPDEALQALAALRNDERWSVRAALRSVELLLDKQDIAGAARMLNAMDPKTPAERKERRFLRGYVALKQNDRSRAVELFTSILKSPQDATREVMVATLLAIAEAHLQSHSPGRGDDFLEDFIEHHPADPELPRIFAKLDQLYAAERTQSRHDLGRWSNEEAEPRRSLSLWYLARAELRLGHRELALEALQQLRARHDQSAAFAPAFIETAELLLSDGRSEEALAALESARSLHPAPAVLHEIDGIAARANYVTRRFDIAARMFEQLSQASSSIAADALYDASLAWMQSGDPARANTTEQILAQKPGGRQARGDLLLERGLLEAAKGDRHASESLEKFLHEFPKHDRAAEAWIALAEISFHATPPRIEDARKQLAHAAEVQRSASAAERADYLAIWIEDAASSSDGKVIELSRQFIDNYGGSSRVTDVRWKLAEAYFQRQDFANAQTQFEILAQQEPNSPEAEKALFFAAQSAMQSMGGASLDRALILFDNVVKRDGELKWPARNAQAVIERKLGKPQDAITLYDEVTRGDAKPAEKREALCGKADTLYELGSADPENYRRAITLYDQLAGDKQASGHWRHQALFKKGMCLEKLNAPAEALATFYQIVEDDSRVDRQREYFWFYKAGFNAARLLEEASKWQPAAAIYEKLAFAGGARSEEAKSRLDRLRLEHFLWDQ